MDRHDGAHKGIGHDDLKLGIRGYFLDWSAGAEK
jgi:hypothetical protein